jgi:hypothetical protein
MAPALVALAAACSDSGTSVSGPQDADGSPVAEETDDTVARPSASDDSEASASEGAEAIDGVPEGSVALYYRARFDTRTESLRGTNITWEEGSLGILRLIPETGRVDLMKSATSPSYAKNAIYALTVGGRLFVIRDWGADWTSKNKSFGIEEIDPHTGTSISSTDINAEWFTILDDRIFFKREVKTDLFGNRSSGGELAVKRLGSTDDTELAAEAPRFQSVGGQLVWVDGSQLLRFDPSSGDLISTSEIASVFTENIWPRPRSVFYGDSAVYWAIVESDSTSADIVMLTPDGQVERLGTLDLEQDETDLVIDESAGHLMVATVGPAPPRGIAVKRIFLLAPGAGLEEIETDQHIPSARIEAGGGLQALVP